MTEQIRDKFLVFGAPDIRDDEIEEVTESLRSGWLGTGPKVAKFEGAFAAYKGVKESQIAAVNSCTAALHVSLIAAGIGPGDEVITTPMTFAATVNAIIHSGATPVLADIDPTTMNIAPAQIEAKISPKTRAVLPVHMAGRPCDMAAIMRIACQHNLMVIEDCAHAIETEYQGQKVGTLGDFGCFSFYVTKNVVTGEGGMIIARNEEHIARAKVLALHGMSKDAWRRFSDDGYKHYYVVECGYKYNMMDIQAAIGLHQLARVEENWQRRRAIWQTYQQALADLPVTRPAEAEENTRHAYHLYTLLIDEACCGVSRDQFLAEMTARKIGVGVHYLSIPEHPYYQERFGWRPEDYPHAMRVGRQTVSIPLSPGLSNQDVEDVITAVTQTIFQVV
ncbi:MAG: DegT/DnrJ/EryC1/StrS family aminotransferase [Anaerolineales bacterium]|nr:DegT/DnrJ/EryC1/StrS family aminotransferase [Anaerolineales bacterium]